jgi:hypothetical protein
MLLFLAICQIHNSRAEEVFTHLRAIPKVTPYLLNVSLNHLQTENIPPNLSQKIIKSLETINENIEKLKRADQTFFIISEMYKSILNFKFKTISSTDTLSTVQIKSISKRLELNKVIYSSFAQFIIQSTILDFKDFIKDDYFDNFQALKNTRSSSYLKENKLKKILKYSGQWVNIISSTTPNQFNKICTELLVSFLKNAAIQSKIFLLHAPQLVVATPILTGFPSVKIQSFMAKDFSNLPVDQISAPVETRREALETVKQLEIDPVERASEDIDAIFKNGNL